MVELRGFEPLTFSLRTRRATNCATAPCALEREEEVTTGTAGEPESGLGTTRVRRRRPCDRAADSSSARRRRLGRLCGLAGQGAVGLVVARGADAGELDGPDRTTGAGLVDVRRKRHRQRVPQRTVARRGRPRSPRGRCRRCPRRRAGRGTRRRWRLGTAGDSTPARTELDRVRRRSSTTGATRRRRCCLRTERRRSPARRPPGHRGRPGPRSAGRRTRSVPRRRRARGRAHRARGDDAERPCGPWRATSRERQPGRP